MALITESELQQRAFNVRKAKPVKIASSLLKEAKAETTVFLSHSHHDKGRIEYARDVLAALDADIYVDWEDPTVPSITQPETARIIKARIQGANKFVMLASQNALGSKWVPWELGFADATKGLADVAIWPVADDYGRWEGSEYVAIYRRIEIADDGDLAVFSPNTNKGVGLDTWLAS
ncbi:MAG: toll/interleukin-1 receptor domain-containing protein [Planctomycetota bacterium]